MRYYSVSSVKKKLSQKEILSQSAWFFFRIFCRMDIYFKRPIIYQSGITMNTSATITVLPNFQFNLIFSVLKKSCKNEYICSSNVCLTDIITSSRINVIIFFHKWFFLSLKMIESYLSIHIIWWNKVKIHSFK